MAYEGIRTSDHYEPVVAFNPNGAERQTGVLRGRARDGLDAGQMVWDAPPGATPGAGVVASAARRVTISERVWLCLALAPLLWLAGLVLLGRYRG